MRLTFLLMLLIIIGFIYTIYTGSSVISDYGFSGHNLVERPYTLVTSIFLHGSLEHLISNLLALLFFGMAVEAALGKSKMLLIFFIGAFLGSLLSLFIYPADIIGIGASGGIFALMGTAILVKPLGLTVFPFIIPLPIAIVGVFYALYNVYAFALGAGGNVSYVAHVGGLTLGLGIGIRREGWKKSITILVLTTLVLIMIPLVWTILESTIFRT